MYVVPFPGPGGKVQISTAGGSAPKWRRDGKELFYLAPDDTLMAAAVKGDDNGFEAGAVRPLFRLRTVGTTVPSPYDVSADGQRFLVTTLPPATETPPFTVVLNWAAGFKN